VTTLERPASAVFHRRPGDVYPVFLRGQGCEMWDATGKRYLDLSSGMAWAASLGQGRADIAAALAEQAGRLTYIHNAWASTDRQEEYAWRLTSMAPDGFTRAMFTSGGSETNELAMRIARQYHLARGDRGRWKVISLRHSYHGATVGALSMTGRVNVNEMLTTDYADYLLPFPKVEPYITYRGELADLSPGEAGARAAGWLAEAIEAEGPETVSVFIVEPILGAGMIVAPDGYLAGVRAVCERYGVLLIADEVMTGAGRTGSFLRVAELGVTPDMVTMAKAISGGYAPLGAVLIHERVAEALIGAGRRLDHVHTHSGHPISCAVGLAVLDVLEREGLIEQARVRGEYLRATVREALDDLGIVGEVRGVGLASGIEYVRDPATRDAWPESAGVARSIWEGMLERGYILPSLHYQGSELIGDFSYLTPAFVISEAQVDEAADALRATVLAAREGWVAA
jgi:adenosylmethionine-8-amino-7-oxononanoate aminotransferase